MDKRKLLLISLSAVLSLGIAVPAFSQEPIPTSTPTPTPTVDARRECRNRYKAAKRVVKDAKKDVRELSSDLRKIQRSFEKYDRKCNSSADKLNTFVEKREAKRLRYVRKIARAKELEDKANDCGFGIKIGDLCGYGTSKLEKARNRRHKYEDQLAAFDAETPALVNAKRRQMENICAERDRYQAAVQNPEQALAAAEQALVQAEAGLQTVETECASYL